MNVISSDANPSPPADPKALSDGAKAAADARTAEAAAMKAERELAERESPLAKALREAEAQKGIAAANQEAAAARQKQLAALIPDPSKVTVTPLEVKGDQALFGSALSQRALVTAGKTIAKEAAEAVEGKKNWRVLVTSDATLATSDSAHLDVVSDLKQLHTAASKIIDETSPQKIRAVAAAAIDAAAALASAIPSALSLLSAHRTVSTTSTVVDSLAAAAVTAGALKRRVPSAVVIHDDVRLLPTGGAIQNDLEALGEKRQTLVGRKIALHDEGAKTTKAIAELEETIKGLDKSLAAAPAREKKALEDELKRQNSALADDRRRLSEGTLRIGLIESVTTAIDNFVASLRTTTPGAARTPLAAAVLHEQLHEVSADQPNADKFTHVLFIKSEPGSNQQVVEDRPFWLKDKFSVVGIVNVTYMLLDVSNSAIVVAGSAGGQAVATGSIGSDFSVTFGS